MKNKKKALVLFSGGQDSTTCLQWALNRYKEVQAISFLYGQRHKVELEQAKLICQKKKVPLKVIDFNDIFHQLCSSDLLSLDSDISQRHESNANLPASFVPNRNQIFLSFAHSYAQKVQAEAVVTGVCETDYSGYPDCRQEFIEHLQVATNLGSFGSKRGIAIETPLMFLSKSETFKLAQDEGIFDFVIEYSHTCYEGNRSIKHEWGYGCGACPACILRKNGYEEFRSNK
jgi:7-cyano-7-deazaguanine synthase